MKRILSAVFCCFIAYFSQCQEFELTFQDSLSKEVLPFVTAYLKNNGVGATGDQTGKMVLTVSHVAEEHDTLICSYFGYEKKFVPVDVTKSQQLTILLVPTVQNIEEVTVKGSRKQLTAKQIVKKVLRNTADNYATQPVNLNALYRETFWEDGHAAHISEAVVKIHYNKYPQGMFQRRDWKEWHYDDSYAFELNYSQFDGFPNQFNSKGDRVELIEARSTENNSKYRFSGSIIGGPLSITSKDYLKYQSDFLDSDNFNKYAYEKRGVEFINGKTYYVIHFYPLEANRSMSISFGRKLKRSIYVGEMYVDRESFAVVRVRFQLAHNVDFGYYQQFVPLDYTVEIDYKQRNDIWTLDKIKLSQVRSYGMRSAGRSVLYQSDQELFVTHVNVDSVEQIPLDKEWRHTRKTSLRDYEFPYNAAYWNTLGKDQYPALSASIVEDLTKEKSLEEQFSARFKQREDMHPPVAEKIDYTFEYPLDTLNDEYQWFFDADKEQEFYQYLNDENEYAENFIISGRKYQKRFFKSIRNFYPKDTTEQLTSYKKGQIVWDVDSLGNGIYYEYLDSVERLPVFNLAEFQLKRPRSFIQGIKFSKSAVAVQYTANGGLDNQVIILNKGSLSVLDSLSGIYSYEWGDDSTLYYTQENEVKRSDKLYRRNVNTQEKTLLMHELDLTYDVSVSQSKSFLFAIVESKSETEIHALRKDALGSGFELMIARKEGVYNAVKEFNGTVFVLTNDNALNNKIIQYDSGNWVDVVSNAKKRLINDFVVTENFMVLHTFDDGFCKLQYQRIGTKKWREIEMPVDVFSADIVAGKHDKVSVHYSAPKIPWTTAEFDLNSEQLTVQEKSDIKREYSYELRYMKTSRVFAKAKDGTKIPITISESRNPRREHKGLILKVYGAYGAYPGGQGFSSEDIILMKDGFTIAYAHVRGGRIMGNQWYEDGKLMNKENSFGDYIACAEYLIDKEYTDAQNLVGYGQSAGGLVVGCAINRRPELFNTVILDHAYLDALTTMMNDTLPLTTDHYKEVGNPKEAEYYELMKQYSVYQNISVQNYPNILFIAGSNDYRTPTWQIAKCAAKIRDMNTDAASAILFKTDIGSGHMGSTQGDQWQRDMAFKNAFIYYNLFGVPLE